jgi:mRNA interferase MazF
MELNQYTIVLVRLGPTIGSEIQKTRPCLILSPNQMNTTLNTVVVAPMTTTNKRYPTRVAIRFQNRDGFIALDQIRTIDKSRIAKAFESISSAKQKKVKSVLQEMLVD